MNALVQYQPPAVPAFTMTEIETVATAIARGGLFGSKDPYAVLTLCMLAQAEGQHPAVVFRDYHIISGKPSKKAEAMQRDFLMAGGKIEWHQLDDDCCDATFSHPAGGSARISWDKARVKQAQLGGNAMHSKYPRQMLRARVISEGVRTVFPGATSGLYVPDEVVAFDDPKPATPAMPEPKRARDLKAEKPALESPARKKAEDWTNAHIEAIENAVNGDDLDAILNPALKALAKLERDHPDLHQRATEAYQARADAFDDQPAPAQAAAPEPPSQSDEQAGSDTTADAETDIIAHINRKTRVLDVQGIVNSRIGELDEAAQDRVKSAAMERIGWIRDQEAGAK